MTRAVFIEDRVLMLNALRTSVDWESNDIEAIGFFESCDEALPVILESNPDVIVTDIVMHGMSGIQLSEFLYQQKSDIKIIIISAHSQFSYAQKAVKIGVFDYFEKPVDYKALVSSIRKAGEERRYQEQIRQYVRNHKPFYRDRFFTRLLLGYVNPEEIEQELEFLDLSMEGQITVINIDIHQKEDAIEQSMKREILRLRLMKMISDTFGRQKVFGPFLLRDQDITLIILSAFDQEALGDLLSRFSRSNQVVAHAGIGEPVFSVSMLAEAYTSACESADACFLFDESVVLRSDELPNESCMHWRKVFRSEEALFKALDQDDELKVHQVFCSLRKELLSVCSKQDALKMLIKSMLFKVDAYQRQDDSTLEDALQLVDQATSLEAILNTAETWCIAGFRSAKEEYSKRRNQIICKVDRFVEENYGNAKLSLREIAKHVAMSPNYLSSMYKRECGRGIHDYISELRIDKARELLLKTDSSIGSIGEMVGFINPYYFSMSFKKITQFTPTEYRRRNNVEK